MERNKLLEQANNLRDNGSIESAINIYNQLVNRYPNDAEIFFNKAVCYLETRPAEALMLFKKVIELDPNAYVAYYNICLIGHHEGLFNEANKIRVV